MNKNSRYFIELLTAFLKKTIPTKPVNIDWIQVYSLANIHFVSGAVYVAIQRLQVEDRPKQAILKRFKSDFFNTILRYEEQEKEYRAIVKKLNEEKIEHLFFKGTILREYYPVKQMRTLGDLDFLLHEKDHEAVNEAFMQIGFKNLTTIGHWQYKKGNLLVEGHDKMMYSNINSKMNYVSYFENAWDNAISTDNSYTYELKPEYHLIFLLTHIAKHFYDAGAGVRMILDIAVVINQFGDTLNFSYIWQELKKLKLDVFAENIFGLCDKWFGIKVPCVLTRIEDGSYESIAKYILEGGTFGSNNRNEAIHLIMKQYEKANNRNLAQFMAFFSKIFLNYDGMKKIYPILIKQPFLLPFAWIVRGVQCITKKRKKTINILKGFANCSNKAEEVYAVMKKSGL